MLAFSLVCVFFAILNRNIQAIPYLLYLAVLSFPLFLAYRRKDILNPLFLTAIVSFFVGAIWGGIIGIEGISNHRDYHYIYNQDIDLAVTKFFLSHALFLLCVYSAYFIFPKIKVASRFTLQRHSLAWSNGVIVVSLMFFILSFIFFTVALKAGGVADIFSQRSINRNERISAVHGAHLLFPLIYAYLICIVWFVLDKKVIFRVIYWLFFLAFMFISVGISGSRATLGVVAMMMFFIYIYHFNKIPYAALMISLLLLVVIVSSLSYSRGLASVERADVSVVDYIREGGRGIKDVLEETSRRQSESNGGIGIFLNAGNKIDYQYGKTYQSIPFVFIPSRLLPFEKPSAGGYHYVNTMTGSENTAWPIGHVGEAYWNFSYLGVSLVGFLLGVIYKLSYTAFMRHGGIYVLVYLGVVFRFIPSSDGVYALVHYLAYSSFIYFLFFLSSWFLNLKRQVTFPSPPSPMSG